MLPPPQLLHPASSDSFSSLRLFSSSSSLPPLLPSSHLSLQASHLSIGLHRVILPSSRNSAALLVSLAMFRTQLFPYTRSFCCCSSFIANVPFLYRHAGVTQSAHCSPRVRSGLCSSTYPLPLSVPPLRTIPLLNTRICPPLSQSLAAYVLYFRLPRLSFTQSLVTNSVSCSSCLPFATSTRSSA